MPVQTVVTPGRYVPPIPEHERTEAAVDDLSQTKLENAVASLQPLLKVKLNVQNLIKFTNTSKVLLVLVFVKLLVFMISILRTASLV